MNNNTAMNKRSAVAVIAGILLLFPCIGVAAQSDSPSGSSLSDNISSDNTSSGSSSSGNTRQTGWHLDAGGGVQALFSSDAANLSFGQRFTPFVSVGAGKWISPFWGVRLQAAGYSLNGFCTTEGTYLSDPLGSGLYGTNDPVRNQVTIRPDGSYRHYLRYLNVQLAVEFSLFNLLGGYRENRRWDIIPALGAGYLRSLGYKGTPVTDNLSVNASLKGKYALTSRWDISMEAAAAAFDGNFDGRITGMRYEAYAGVMLGISYNFAKPVYRRRPVNPQKQAPPAAGGNGRALPLDRVGESLSAIEKKLEKLERVSGGNEAKDPLILASILFGLNTIDPFPGQDIHLTNVAKYLDEHPDAKIRLDGYGDRETGTPKQNLKTAVQRAENVRRMLIEEYGVAPERIETQAIGSNEQPYEKNEWNRLVVISVVR
ncbi:MAG: OmpA family protein [Prevotellaceae bacterium]|jgi:outer membrane protein OmpA-like peptidoglycan-associated protein|nr:OmpA family protein [Prevotellaceae bacterium]